MSRQSARIDVPLRSQTYEKVLNYSPQAYAYSAHLLLSRLPSLKKRRVHRTQIRDAQLELSGARRTSQSRRHHYNDRTLARARPCA